MEPFFRKNSFIVLPFKRAQKSIEKIFGFQNLLWKTLYFHGIKNKYCRMEFFEVRNFLDFARPDKFFSPSPCFFHLLQIKILTKLFHWGKKWKRKFDKNSVKEFFSKETKTKFIFSFHKNGYFDWWDINFYLQKRIKLNKIEIHHQNKSNIL